MKKFLIWLLVLEVFLSLCACSSNPFQGYPGEEENQQSTGAENTPRPFYTTSAAQTTAEGQAPYPTTKRGFQYYSLGEPIEVAPRSCKEGKLIAAYSNARLVSRKSDIPNLNGIYDPWKLACQIREDGIHVYSYNGVGETPSFVQDDGEFLDGIYLLLLDVTIENIDCACYTTSDIGESGYPLGMYEDPYVFREVTMRGEWVWNSSEPYYRAGSAEYFSRMNEQPEDPLVFRLLPGETITYTVGFFIDELVDLEHVFIDPHNPKNDSGERGPNSVIELNLKSE